VPLLVEGEDEDGDDGDEDGGLVGEVDPELELVEPAPPKLPLPDVPLLKPLDVPVDVPVFE
jgi:hypothetical protein